MYHLVIAFAVFWTCSFGGHLCANGQQRFLTASTGGAAQEMQSGEASWKNSAGRRDGDLFGVRRRGHRIGLFFPGALLTRPYNSSVLVTEGRGTYQRTSRVELQNPAPFVFVGQEALLSAYGSTQPFLPIDSNNPSQPESEEFAQEFHLEPGWTPDEVLRTLGTPETRIRLANREIWQYSGFSLLFEDALLKEIR